MQKPNNNQETNPNAPQSGLCSSQRKALLHMINLNAEEGETDDTVWKILIYDDKTQQIISPILKVNDLRQNGVTVNMNINNKNRQPIVDVPAVYFLSPTQENIDKLAQDWNSNLYSEYYLNFDSPLPRYLLENLAKNASDANSPPNIRMLYDQYLNFITPDTNMFNLAQKNTFTLLNQASTSETQIEECVRKIAEALFSVLRTMNVVPIIRCPKGNAAEMVAAKLDTKLRDYLANSRVATDYSLTRPVLVILDRNIDLTSMLNHSWIYSAMVHDLLDMKFNRVSVQSEGKNLIFDIDANDFFWMKNANMAFPAVAEDVNVEITKYKTDVNELTESCGVTSMDEIGDNTKNLALAITQMPKLTERKRIIDMHMNIAFTLMEIIKERQIDGLFEMEETISRQTKAAILEAVKDTTKNPQDKIRLFLSWYLSVPSVSKEEVAEFEQALTEAGCNIDSVTYVKKAVTFNKTITSQAPAPAVQSSGSTGGDFLGKFTSIGNKLTGTLKDAGVSSHIDTFISGVKNMLPNKKDLAVTRIANAFMEGNSSSEFDDYLYFDPKTRNAKKPTGGRGGQQHSDAIVFVVGGGNYAEYQNLMEYAKIGRKNIVYGSTEILTCKAFLEQLDTLGNEGK